MRLFVPLLLLAVMARADVHPLLADAAERWVDARYRWKFVQVVREYDSGGLAEERLELYDPTRGEDRRWALLKINGKPPTQEEWEPWNKRKNKPRRKDLKPLSEYLDLEHAVIRHEDERTVTFDLTMQRTVAWIIPGEKIGLTVTINKQSHLIERGRAEISAPFNIALGLAKVIDLDVDLELPDDDQGTPDANKAHGTAYAVVNKLGRRVEYSWSEFTRVEPPPQPAPASARDS